jgi:putative PIN family toxin of toxin-antitoxin system
VLIVIDTNVLVSGNLSTNGPPGRILDLVLTREIQLAYDDRILAEYEDVLRRSKFRFAAALVDPLLDAIRLTGTQVIADPLSVTLPDASDLPFLEVAVASHAMCLVTGNSRHFEPISGQHTIHVRTPREFVEHWPNFHKK